MESVQAAAPNSALDHLRRHAQREQLVARDHPMLPSRHLSHGPI
jgi:hypothetical protein